jgi:predicted GNAT superfamily acetyltransferase
MGRMERSDSPRGMERNDSVGRMERSDSLGKVAFMRRTLEPTPAVAARAEMAARQAAHAAGIEIVPIDSLGDIRAASSLFAEIWGTGNGDDQIPPEILRALTHSGNYAASAFVDGMLAGAVVGFLGHDDDGTYLHSHILGVSARRRGSNVGFALKQHQRAWALSKGFRKVTWTFDPLVRRNAYFNIQKLGAHAAEYYESFYGQMRDAVNAGDETDRVLVVWHLEDERAEEAASGRIDEPSGPDATTVGSDEEDGSVLHRVTNGDTIYCATPDDIVSLRRTDPEQALRWRVSLRSSLGEAMRDGYTVSGFTRSGWYVLKRESDGSRG